MSDSSRRICAIGSDWIPFAMVGEKARLFLISEMSKGEDNYVSYLTAQVLTCYSYQCVLIFVEQCSLKKLSSDWVGDKFNIIFFQRQEFTKYKYVKYFKTLTTLHPL